MLAFKQSVTTFEVTEELFYEPSGHGEHVFAQIRKKGISTQVAKRRISEVTGVKEKWMGHAGQKDTAGTAIQWLSWPSAQQQRPFEGRDDLTVLKQVLHVNKLGIGHVKYNHFKLVFDGDGPFPATETLEAPFPNFYGRQRFGRSIGQDLKDLITSAERSRDAISVLQSALFNTYLRQRLATGEILWQEDELWTATNGKRWFAAPLDDEMLGRLSRGEVAPTGPIFGYKAAVRPEEQALLARLAFPEGLFHRWGKSAKGARRPLLVKPIINSLTCAEGSAELCFSLPSGAYASSYLLSLFQPSFAQMPETEWPDLTLGVTLQA